MPYTEWTLQFGEELVTVTATLDANGDVVFTYSLDAGTADLNGFYIDIGNDGGTIKKLDGGNNMLGSDTDGDKLDGFDAAEEIGTVGGNDDNTTSGTLTFTLAELGVSSLEELASAEIGIRATSVGVDSEDSLKLADTGTYYPGYDEPTGDDFPDWNEFGSADISHVTLIFDTEEGDLNGDGFYTVKIDGWTDGADSDLDNGIADILFFLGLDDTNLLGSTVKGGNDPGSAYFAYGDSNTNGTEADDLPAGIGFDLTGGNGNEDPASAIDAVYDYSLIF